MSRALGIIAASFLLINLLPYAIVFPYGAAPSGPMILLYVLIFRKASNNPVLYVYPILSMIASLAAVSYIEPGIRPAILTGPSIACGIGAIAMVGATRFNKHILFLALSILLSVAIAIILPIGVVGS